MTELQRVRLPDAHTLATIAANVAVDVSRLREAGVTGERIRSIAGVLDGLSRQGGNFGPWLSAAGDAVHSAIDHTCKRRLATTAELGAELRRMAIAYARAADVLESDLEQLGTFSVALSRAALREARHG